jgi:hypothetical protein
MTTAMTTRAPVVAAKLAAAGNILSVLESGSAELALAEVEGIAGATGRMRAHDQKIGAARAEVEKLQAAHRRATELDEAAAATTQREARRAQFAAIQKLADDRLKIMTGIAAAIETTAKSYIEFLDATEAMQLSMPALANSVDWRVIDILIDGSPLPAGLDAVLSGEMFRHAAKAAGGRFVTLPGAKPPTEAMRAQPNAIEPATEALARTNNWLLGLVKDRFEALDQADEARVGKVADMSPAQAMIAPPDEYAGLTVEKCATGCSVERCVISGKPYCAHPRKGGLQDTQKLDPGAIARFERAVAVLGTKPTEIKNA